MFRIRCPACGGVIYESEEERSVKLVLRPLDYRCPHCGARLNPLEVRARVVPA
ncbi:MAG: hypothetical protein ACP5ID_02195 [Conexivisphaera sp.]